MFAMAVRTTGQKVFAQGRIHIHTHMQTTDGYRRQRCLFMQTLSVLQNHLINKSVMIIVIFQNEYNFNNDAPWRGKPVDYLFFLCVRIKFSHKVRAGLVDYEEKSIRK